MRRSMSAVSSVSAWAARVAIGVLLVAAPGPASAQQTDADFSAYCRAKFPNSAYQKFAQSWGTEHACVQGGTRQGIDLGEACRLTTGSRHHEISGARVLCEGSADAAPTEEAKPLSSSQLAQYCIDHFPNSSYERRAEADGIAHYCRRPGATSGFTLQRIDLREVCQAAFGTSEFAKQGVQVVCTGEAEPDVAPGDRWAQGGRRSEGALPKPPGPSPMPFPLPDRGPEPLPVPERSPRPAPGPGPDPGAAKRPAPAAADLSMACQSLGGRWQSGTLTRVDEIRSSADQVKQKTLQGCDAWGADREMCRNQTRVEHGFRAYFPIFQILQCHIAFAADPGASDTDVKTAKREACAIVPVLDELRSDVNSAGGKVPPLGFMASIDEAEFRESCN